MHGRAKIPQSFVTVCNCARGEPLRTGPTHHDVSHDGCFRASYPVCENRMETLFLAELFQVSDDIFAVGFIRQSCESHLGLGKERHRLLKILE